MDSICIFLRHHVHVSLKDDSLHVLAARGGRFPDDDVSDRAAVDDGFEAMAYSPVI